MAAGAMHYLLAFDRPTAADDGRGGTEAGWTEVFQAPAAIMFLRGGETVQAARLTGRQPAVATIWSSVAARTMTTDWRARDARTGTIYNIRAIVPTDDRARLEITCESGVAT